MPALGMGQVYRASLGGARLSWSKQPFPGVVLGWWLVWGGSISLGRYAGRQFQSADIAADYIQVFWTSIAANVLALMALAFILQIVREIGEAQAKWPQLPEMSTTRGDGVASA